MTYVTIAVNQSTDPAAPDVAADRVGGSDFQRIKVSWGAENTATEVVDSAAGQFPVGGSAIGIVTEAAPASDTASSGLNGRLQRLAQRLTTLLAIFTGTTATNAAAGTADVGMIGATSNLRLLGISCQETASTPAEAEFYIRHGTTAAGAILAHYNLGPNESARDWFGPMGMLAASGVFLDRVSGNTDVTVHTVVAP